MTHYNRVELC